MRKLCLTLLTVLSCACITLGAAACKGGTHTSGSSGASNLVLNGFDVEEELFVQNDSVVVVDIPFVLTEQGEPVSIYVSISDSNGNYVELNGGAFLVTDLRGYTVKYVAEYGGRILSEKTTAIKVYKGGLDIEKPSFITVGEEYAIEVETDGEISYLVTKDGESVEMMGNCFTPQKTGNYDITVMVMHGDVESRESYTVYARTKSLQGEIETFGSDWSALSEQFSEIDRKYWVQTTSQQSIIKYGDKKGQPLLNHLGKEGEFLAFHSSGVTGDDEYDWYHHYNIELPINPRNDAQYYQQLVAEGYEYVSMYVYLDDDRMIPNNLWGRSASAVTGNTTEPSQSSLNTFLMPNQWTELRFMLYDGALGQRDSNGSFISSLNYYRDGNVFLKVLNNVGTMDGLGIGCNPDPISVYVSGIFARKPTVKAALNLATGQKLDCGSIFGLGKEYTYKIYENGKEFTLLTEGNHALDVEVYKNGEFFEIRTLDLSIGNSDNKTVTFATVDQGNAKVLNAGSWVEDPPSIVQNPLGKTGTYYKIQTKAGENYEIGLKIKPEMSKEYLMMYQDGCLVFDLYVDGAGFDQAEIFCLNSTNEGRTNTYYKTIDIQNQKWQKVSLPVSVLIEHYDTLSNAMTTNWSHLGKLLSLGWKNDAPAITMYVGNIRVCAGISSADEVGVDFETIWGNS